MEPKLRLNRALCRVSFLIIFSVLLITGFAQNSYAGGYILGTGAQDYLTAPAVGSNVVGYLIGDYIGPDLTHLHLFVKKCECLKRIDYKYEGVLATYPQMLSKEEFDGLTPEVLIGMIDTDGILSRELTNGEGLIAVIDNVLEFKKIDNRFAARVSIKFVYQVP